MTHTYVVMEVSGAAYTEIRDKLSAAGYDHAINSEGEIDMHGIAIIQQPNETPIIVHESTTEQRRANYATHKIRVSDSSLYDEVCTECGARDYTADVDELSENSCTGKVVV
jgi:hypothetical protein